MTSTARHQHWIDGRDVPPAGRTWLPTLDPATRESGDEIAAGGADDVDRAVAAAQRARHGWADHSPADRAAVLHRIADLLHEDAETRGWRPCTSTHSSKPSARTCSTNLRQDSDKTSAGQQQDSGGPAARLRREGDSGCTTTTGSGPRGRSGPR
ncbi:aldehyde dehydrogenase family protein [Streptomyces sp. NPDC006872]|uniref:aldehyde dehydrogenase family protein n=1 Tax=Streptomyces sp. NPDC006872 TaxID=3155720 RepID=UPI0033FEEEEA